MASESFASNNRFAIDEILTADSVRDEVALGDELQNSSFADPKPFGGLACGGQILARTRSLLHSEW